MKDCLIGKHAFTKFRVNDKKVQTYLYCGKTRKELNWQYEAEFQADFEKLRDKTLLN